MREVETSDGEVWECFVEWEGRRALHSSARYLRKTREARARRKAEGRSMDIADGCDPFVGIDGFVAIVVLIAVVLLLVAIGPEFIAVLFGVVELGAVLLLAAIGFGVRTLFRRPWRVVAVSSGGKLRAWRQVGFLAARRLVDEIVDGLRFGHEPITIARGFLEPINPTEVADDAPLGLHANSAYRWLARLVVLAAAIASIAILIARST